MQSGSSKQLTQDNSALLIRLTAQRLTKLREVTKRLGIPNLPGKKEEIVSRLYQVLLTEEGIKKVRELCDSDFIEQVLIGPQNLNQILAPRQGEQLTTLGKGTITVQGKVIAIRCICQSGQKPLIQCTNCKTWQHTKCMLKNVEIKPYECVLCMVSKINPFNEVVQAILMPYKIIPYPQAFQQPERAQISFELQEGIRNQIFAEGGSLQIQIRCIKIDGIGYEHSWPKIGALQFNDQLIIEFKQPENPNSKKRKDEAINITTLVRTGNNTIEIMQHSDQEVYCGMVLLIKQRDAKFIIQNVRNKYLVPELICKEKLKKYFVMGNSDDIAFANENLRMSLRCPLTMQQIETPVRGRKCTHIQPFSLETYVELMRTAKVRKWSCPVCRGKAFELEIDGYLQKICQEVFQNPSAVECEIFYNGDYKIIYDEEEIKEQELKNKRKRENESEEMEQSNEVLQIEDKFQNLKKRKINISNQQSNQVQEEAKEQSLSEEVKPSNQQQKIPLSFKSQEDQQSSPKQKQVFVQQKPQQQTKQNQKPRTKIGSMDQPIELD